VTDVSFHGTCILIHQSDTVNILSKMLYLYSCLYVQQSRSFKKTVEKVGFDIKLLLWSKSLHAKVSDLAFHSDRAYPDRIFAHVVGENQTSGMIQKKSAWW